LPSVFWGECQGAEKLAVKNQSEQQLNISLRMQNALAQHLIFRLCYRKQ